MSETLGNRSERRSVAGSIVQSQLEDALETGEERYRALLESIPESIVVLDPDFRLIVVNKTACTYTRTPRIELQGRKLTDLFPGIDRTAVYAMFVRVMDERVPDEIEQCFESSDGRCRWYEVSAYPVTEGILCISRDMTDRKHAERSLKQSERKYRRLVENLREGIGVVDEEEVIRFVNPAFSRITGYTAETLIGTSLSRLIPDEEMHAIYRETELRRRGEASDYVCTIVRADGRRRTIRVHATPLADDDNRFAGTLGLIQDITEERRLVAENARLRSAVDEIGDMIVMTDVEGRIDFVNRAFERTTGFTAADVNGRLLSSVCYGDEHRRFLSQVFESISSGGSWAGRITAVTKAGDEFEEEMQIFPLHESDAVLRNFIVVKRDVTERLAMERELQQSQKMESVGRLAGGIAHDFNNMLQAIIGNAQLALLETEADRELHELIADIDTAARRSADLTRRLLRFASKETVSPKRLDLREVVSETIGMLSRLVGSSIQVELSADGEVPYVWMDRSQLEQVLTNIVVNARDAVATVDDTGRIDIILGEERRVSCEAGNCRYARIEIRDDGCGMDAETVEKVFEPFFSTKPKEAGTGLGLSTVYGIVRQNRGTVEVESEPGVGTCVTVLLPADGMEPPSGAPRADRVEG